MHPTIHSCKLDPCRCGWPKRDGHSSCPSSFRNADFSPAGAEQQYEGHCKILEQTRVPYFWYFLRHYFQIIFVGFFYSSGNMNLHPQTLEIFSLYHQRNLHLPLDTSSAGPSCAEWSTHPPLLPIGCLSLLFDGGRHADQVANWASLLPVKIWERLAKTQQLISLRCLASYV